MGNRMGWDGVQVVSGMYTASKKKKSSTTDVLLQVAVDWSSGVSGCVLSWQHTRPSRVPKSN